MKLTMQDYHFSAGRILLVASAIVTMLSLSLGAHAAVEFESQYKVTANALYFDGRKVGGGADNGNATYDYKFGPKISAHGDAIKVYKNFIFTTWYRGDKFDRHMMLSRYNTVTGVVKTIRFPHRHTGLRGQWWIGESHNTIAVGISPKDEKIHLLFDMHSYNNKAPFVNDYFRYAFSKKNAATVPDDEFKLSLFIADGPNDYNHVSLNGTPDRAQFENLTYPRFFINNNNDLMMHMRVGGNDNGAYVFSKYNASTSKWDKLTRFNHLNAKTKGQAYNWGLYGSMKYVDGKLRVAFQRRSANKNDKYQYQNGIYYAYSDDQSGRSKWKDHTGKGFAIPFANADIIKIYEPGNQVQATGKNEVYIVGGFDFTVTDRGDVHIISRVRDNKNNVTKHIHSYKKNGTANFTHTTNFKGASQLYTYGNNVYIIGLASGRPFVEKATGGTNNFTNIYEDTTGDSYSHGVPHIHEGKLYYYLQEKGTGTKRGTYVQIIDLGLGSSNNDDQGATPVGPEGFEFAGYARTTFPLEGTVNVAYGANGIFNFLFELSGTLDCSNATFGDPLVGVRKACFTQPVNTGGSSDSDCPNGVHNVTQGERTEIALGNKTCLRFNLGLKGKTLQVWDSDTRTSCDFRGTVESVDGSGSVSVTSNYKQSSDFTGRTIKLTPSNGCKFVKVRSY